MSPSQENSKNPMEEVAGTISQCIARLLTEGEEHPSQQESIGVIGTALTILGQTVTQLGSPEGKEIEELGRATLISSTTTTLDHKDVSSQVANLFETNTVLRSIDQNEEYKKIGTATDYQNRNRQIARLIQKCDRELRVRSIKVVKTTVQIPEKDEDIVRFLKTTKEKGMVCFALLMHAMNNDKTYGIDVLRAMLEGEEFLPLQHPNILYKGPLTDILSLALTLPDDIRRNFNFQIQLTAFIRSNFREKPIKSMNKQLSADIAGTFPDIYMHGGCQKCF